ncbi:MAG: GNAT family N-acetyltransferase [Pseudomonadota bacterium]
MVQSTGTLEISIAESPKDVEAVRQLSRDFFDWLITEFPEQRDKLRTYFDPRNWEKTLNALPSIHARPQGAMLLAKHCGLPVGCVMYHEMSPDVAEVKRLFVSTSARGKGIASHLLTALIESARADGYKELKLDTRTFLSAAEQLYRKHGFVDSDHKINLPEESLEVVVHLRRAL